MHDTGEMQINQSPLCSSGHRKPLIRGFLLLFYYCKAKTLGMKDVALQGEKVLLKL